MTFKWNNKKINNSLMEMYDFFLKNLKKHLNGI